MKKLHSLSLAALALAASLALAACSSMPPENTALRNARANFESAQNNLQTRELAAAELTSAGVALKRADEALQRGASLAEVDHLAYLAQQQVSVAQQTARLKAAETAVASAEAERDRTRLAARTNEADAAQRQALNAQRDAQTAQRAATLSQLDAQAAQRSAEASRVQSEAARAQSEASRAQSEASRAQADASRRDAQAAQMQTADAQARAARLEEQMRALDAKKTARGMVVTVGDVLFDSGRAELKSGSARNMEKLAEFFKTYPERTAVVEGFTDSVGGDAFNQELSTRRASAVRSALLDMGVDRTRISARGYGEAFPVAGNESASGRQMNRRVEIVLSDEKGQVAPR